MNGYRPRTNRGATLEELLRAFFLRAGFFVVRGVPFEHLGEELTDVDLWLYERPTGTARRVQICDIKSKQRPRAIERILYTSGLTRALDIGGAYVATPDKRKSLRALANRVGINLIDGDDLQRIRAQRGLLYEDRISDEQLLEDFRAVDDRNRVRMLQNERTGMLAALLTRLGPYSAVCALEVFRRLSTKVVSSHPGSSSAVATARLSYLAAAIAAVSLDYVSVRAAFRSLDEKRRVILDAVRLGGLLGSDGGNTLEVALALVRKYAPGGASTAGAIENNLRRDLDNMRGEIVAEQAIRLLKDDLLFSVGRELEMACYQESAPTFDELTVSSKSMVGSLLDYSGIERERFANAWEATAGQRVDEDVREALSTEPPQEEIRFEE